MLDLVEDGHILYETTRACIAYLRQEYWQINYSRKDRDLMGTMSTNTPHRLLAP